MISRRSNLKPVAAPPPIAAEIGREDRDIAIRTIWGEARGESKAGKVAVAQVILNRARDAKRRYGGPSLRGVCLKPRQFSCWNANDPNRAKMLAIGEFLPAYRACAEALDIAIANRNDPGWAGIFHYKVRGVEAAWAKGRAVALEIGNHHFFRWIDG